MPNIREFSNTVGGLQPDNGMEQVAARNAQHTEQAFALMGHEIGSGISALGDAYTRIKEQQDLSHGFVAFTAMQLRQTQQLQERMKTADPNDPTVAAKFLSESVDPDIEKFVDGFSTPNGRRAAIEMAGRMREEMGRTAIGMQSNLASEAVTGNLDASLANLSGKTFLDPTSRDAAFATWTAGIDAQLATHPTMSAEDAAKVREHYIEAGRKAIGGASAAGMIHSAQAVGPEAVTQVIDNLGKDPKWPEFLGGDGMERANTAALEARRAAEQDHRNQQNDAIRQDRINANKEMVGLYTSGLQRDGSWHPPADYGKKLSEIAMKYPNGVDASEVAASQAHYKTYLEDQASGRLVQDDPNTASGLWSRVAIPQGSPGALSRAEILTAGANRLLSNETTSRLMSAVEGAANDPAQRHLLQVEQDFFDSKKSLFLGQGQGFGAGSQATPDQQEQFFQFQEETRRAVAAFLAQVPDPAKAEDELFNSNSSRYLGNPQNNKFLYSAGQPASYAPGYQGPLPTPAGSSAAPAKPPAGQPAANGGKLTQDQVTSMIFPGGK